jgi:hypothetical protein
LFKRDVIQTGIEKGSLKGGGLNKVNPWREEAGVGIQETVGASSTTLYVSYG